MGVAAFRRARRLAAEKAERELEALTRPNAPEVRAQTVPAVAVATVQAPGAAPTPTRPSHGRR